MGEVPAEALGRNLVSGGCDLSGLSNDKPPARNAFAGAARIIHHVESEHRFFCRHPKIYVLRRNRRDYVYLLTIFSNQKYTFISFFWLNSIDQTQNI
jgi:hypothetical protein